jgi:hypothetical protein
MVPSRSQLLRVYGELRTPGKDPLEVAQKMDHLKELSGRRLHAVTFIQDYVQFQFEPSLTTNAFTRVTVRPNGETIRGDADDQFRNLLCAQISKLLTLALVRDLKSFDLGFSDGSGISISLRPEDYVGPEAVSVVCDTHHLVI